MSGSGWTCASGGNTCKRSDALSAGMNDGAITVTVNVAANATSPQVNTVTASGGGSASATATDPTNDWFRSRTDHREVVRTENDSVGWLIDGNADAFEQHSSALTGGSFTDTLAKMSTVGGTCMGATPSSLAAGATALSCSGTRFWPLAVAR
jgi:hypothetical protein